MKLSLDKHLIGNCPLALILAKWISNLHGLSY